MTTPNRKSTLTQQSTRKGVLTWYPELVSVRDFKSAYDELGSWLNGARPEGDLFRFRVSGHETWRFPTLDELIQAGVDKVPGFSEGVYWATKEVGNEHWCDGVANPTAGLANDTYRGNSGRVRFVRTKPMPA